MLGGAWAIARSPRSVPSSPPTRQAGTLLCFLGDGTLLGEASSEIEKPWALVKDDDLSSRERTIQASQPDGLGNELLYG